MTTIQATEITVNGVIYVPKGTEVAPTQIGPECIIRCEASGVHIGTIKSRDGREIELLNARRLWSWSGAFTLNEIATKGVSRKNSKISVNVPTITILDAIEIIPICLGVDLTPIER